MSRTLLVLALMIAGCTVDLIAQSTVDVPPGSRVRVSLADGEPGRTARWQVGSLVALSDSVMRFRNGAGVEQAYPVAAIAALEVSAGRRSNAGRGAWIGGLGLGAVGALTSYIEESRCEPSPFDMGPLAGCGSPAGMAALGFVIAGAVGAGAGALIGSAVRTDRWRAVPPRLRSGLMPARIRHPGHGLFTAVGEQFLGGQGDPDAVVAGG